MLNTVQFADIHVLIVRDGVFVFGSICATGIVVDFWDVDIVAGDMGVGPKKFDDVQSIFRVFENARSGRTAP